MYSETDQNVDDLSGNEMSANQSVPIIQPTGELRSLIEKQEVYIGQLEKETKFCRDQLSKVLAQVQVIV